MMSATTAAIAPSSSIRRSPSASTMAKARRPDANIFSKTSFATGPLISPRSTSAISSASASGASVTCSTAIPSSFILRVSSTMIQLLAALALPAAAAVFSK